MAFESVLLILRFLVVYIIFTILQFQNGVRSIASTELSPKN